MNNASKAKQSTGHRGKLVAPQPSASPAELQAALCPERTVSRMTDMIELWHPIGAPKETFPETYPRVQQQVQKMFGPLMDQGVRYVAVSSQGNATKGGQITVTPMGGNTSEVIGILNMIRLELNAAKIVAEQDPEYRCPNFGSASRALRIRIPAQADR